MTNVCPVWLDAEQTRDRGTTLIDEIDASLVLRGANYVDIGDFLLDGTRIFREQCGEPPVCRGREDLYIAAGPHHDHIQIVRLHELHHACGGALTDGDNCGQHSDAHGHPEHHQERPLLMREERSKNVASDAVCTAHLGFSPFVADAFKRMRSP